MAIPSGTHQWCKTILVRSIDGTTGRNQRGAKLCVLLGTIAGLHFTGQHRPFLPTLPMQPY
jgi:hypothetical protein